MPSKRTKRPQLNDRFNVMKYLVLLAVIIIPSLYAGVLTWANYDPTGRIDTVPAAIVNEDRPAQPATGDPLNLGADITDELLSNTSTSNFSWSVMSAGDAATALKDGSVMAVLTIPADFSANVASVSENDADAARRAQLDITTNDGSNLVAGNIASALGTSVTDRLTQRVSAEYLDNIYAGFTTVHDSLGQAADGAGQLSEGATGAREGGDQLVVGLTNLKSGTDSLAAGSSEVASGAVSARDGAAQLSEGANTLEEGAGSAHNGATSLATGSGELASGASSVNDGATRLAEGSSATKAGASALSSGAASTNEGAEALAGGVLGVNEGAGALAGGLSELDTEVSGLPAQADALAQGTETLAEGASGLAAGAQDLEDAAGQLATGAGELADGSATALAGARELDRGAAALKNGTGALASGAQEVSTGAQTLLDNWDYLTDEQKLAAVTELKAGAGAVSAGAEAANLATGELAGGATALVGDENGGLTKLSAGASSLQGGASALASGATTLSDGADTLSTGASDLKDKAGELPAGMSALAEAVAQASSGASTLSEGTGQLVGGAQSLAGGTGELAAGAASLAGGADSLASGAGELATGTGTLVSGAQELSSGANQLADGTGELAAGAGDLASGADSLAEGTGALASGAGELASGAGELTAGAGSAVDGATSLTDGLDELEIGSSQLSVSLADATGQVPSYSTAEAGELSEVTSQPVALNKTRLNEVATYGHGLAPYFMSLGLWVGAIAYFMMYPAISRRFAGGGHSGLSTLLGSLAPVFAMGAVQGLVVALVLRFMVDISMASFWGITGLSALTSVTFLAINQALIALLDAPGRFIALILTVLQVGASGGTYPIETAPAFLRAVHPWLPLTHSLEGMRSLVAGGSLGVVSGVFWLLGWLLLAVAATAFSIWLRHRREESASTARLARTA